MQFSQPYFVQPSPWRLIRSEPASGPWNMAVDEAVLTAVGRGDVLPTLRLYGWQPACVSLGFAQKYADVDVTAVQNFGWEIVRRPTGGRAILHIDELTYAVIGPQDEPRLAGSILESYSRLAQGLVHAALRLGLPVEARRQYNPAAGRGPAGPVCFDVPSNYEITVAGKKLIGSAQARRREGVLQHGSLPLCGDLTRITRALVYPTEEARAKSAGDLLEHALTVETALGRPVSWEMAADSFSAGFAEALNIDWVEDTLSPDELVTARRLYAEKYTHPGWTERV